KESRGYSVAHTEWSIARSFPLAVPFVIGADGYGSRVRRALGISFEETGPAAHYAVFEFRTDADLQNEMRIVLGESHTDVLWPLPSGHCRWSFEVPGFADEESPRFKDRSLLSHVSFPILREESLRELVAERAPWFQGSTENFTWRTMVRFERRLAGAFGAGRCWLAGDAAHLTGPVGMQSMNVGFFEARQLAEIVSRLLRNGGSLAELGDYGAHSRHLWNRLNGAGRGLYASAGADEWVSAHASRLLSCLPGHGETLSKLARQIGLEF
ncbi:MAG: FAD-dependent monooxygenase, partial [Acidobacteria bacterium]|nr:FAD-dependent monooxygenase [Acidobacteriota bacterium]